MRSRNHPLAIRFAACLGLAACGRGGGSGAPPADIPARCVADVTGVGRVPVESDYLPRVVACENGAAAPAALQAQAVAARTYLYYELGRVGVIDDGTSDQVYGCGAQPGPQHYAAVSSTSGQVLRHRQRLIAAFYVAGALQSPPTCTGGANDPTATERYVTYNDGKRADAITQTALGWVDPTSHANRGCMSQNGSDCLARAGADYQDILRYYYGADIELVTAAGDCAAP
jgi:hypothetical protein